MRRAFLVALFGLAPLLFSGAGQAYSVRSGDLLIRPVVGPSVNFLRLSVATKKTPPAGLLFGVDLDYHVLREVAVTGSLRPTFSPGFFDGNLSLGAKYRLVQLEAPFIPYASAALAFAFGFPLGYGDAHGNLGLRLAGGVDYFVMRDLAIGVEVGIEPSYLFAPLPFPEISVDALFGVTFRF